MPTLGHSRLFIPFFFLVLAALSCKVEPSFIPSYIEINDVSVDASSINGNSIHDIKAVQVYVNNQTVGTFEIPCKFPIDAEGLVRIQIIPFVKNNGNSQTLVPYKSLEILTDTLQVTREKTSTWSPLFRYRSNVEIVWQEDFEDSSSTLVPIFKDSLNYLKIESRPFNLNNRFTQNSLMFVSRFENNDSAGIVELAYFNKIKGLPTDGRDIILEFDVYTDLPILFWYLRYPVSGPPLDDDYVPFVTVNPTKGNWKRFYLNIVPDIQGKNPATQYELYFRCDKPKDFSGSREFLIDNLRLSYLK
jgi:hypothetical protein